MQNFVPNLAEYDRIIVAFSGGKDSLACLLVLMEHGVDLSKVELWHHDIDGREGSDLMDWTVTRDYCRQVATAFNLPIYFSWLKGGFEREMNRDNCRKAPTVWENPDGTLGQSGGQRGKLSTRLKFPQVSADLSVRWCSAYLKIDVMDCALAGQQRFLTGKTLVITGERAQESVGRAKYLEFEPHRADNRSGTRTPRYIDHWRPVHKMSVVEVWALIAKYRINPHPAYRAGFGRVSCQFCIFGNSNQCASARLISPNRFEKVATYEEKFGVTINRGESIRQRADKGIPYAASQADIDACKSTQFNEQVILPEGAWKMPLGAFAESCGPV
jgi:3'-phosphoadenosine 5'-phosphosulfate sulfotransferase (PAPS reductase)/FAD synthetase